VVQAGAQGLLQGGVDRDEQAADPVGQAGRLAGQVVVEADEDLQLSEGLVAGVDPAQRMRQGTGGVSDDEGITCVCLGVPGVDVGEPAHRQAGKAGHLAAAGAGHRDRQRPDRGGLVNDDQDPAVLAELGEQGPQALLVVRQGLVVQLLAGGVQGRRRGARPCRRPGPGRPRTRDSSHLVVSYRAWSQTW
jgi:hypothetical protein